MQRLNSVRHKYDRIFKKILLVSIVLIYAHIMGFIHSLEEYFFDVSWVLGVVFVSGPAFLFAGLLIFSLYEKSRVDEGKYSNQLFFGVIGSCLLLSLMSYFMGFIPSGFNAYQSPHVREKIATKGPKAYKMQVANYYLNGIGVPADQEKALYWYREASKYELGDASVYAAAIAARLNNDKLANDLFTLTYKRGSDWAEYVLYRSFSKEEQSHFKELNDDNLKPLRSHAISGSADDMFRYAEAIEQKGGNFSFSNALFWYKSAASIGHASAEIKLAFLLQNGSLGFGSLRDAADLYRKRFQKGDFWYGPRVYFLDLLTSFGG